MQPNNPQPATSVTSKQQLNNSKKVNKTPNTKQNHTQNQTRTPTQQIETITNTPNHLINTNKYNTFIISKQNKN